MNEALAEEVARLRAENARLERENTKLYTQFAGCNAGVKRLYEKLNAANCEVGKLTAEIQQYQLNQKAAA